MKEGDFVKVEYVGRIVGTNEVFDVTSEEIARKEGAYNEKYRYGPVLVIIGSGMIVPGVEENLKKMKSGEERMIDVKPDDGFGKRDVKKVKIVALANFIRQKINPIPGEFVEINGRNAKIQSVSGGRVRIDFNHPLSGKDLNYKIRIVQVIEKPVDKVRAITDYYRIESEAKLEGENLELETKENTPDAVQKLLTDIITKWVKEVKSVKFVSEKNESKPEPKPDEKKKTEPIEGKVSEQKNDEKQ